MDLCKIIVEFYKNVAKNIHCRGEILHLCRIDDFPSSMIYFFSGRISNSVFQLLVASIVINFLHKEFIV